MGALRTLLISDLHLGIRRGNDVLRGRAARERLLSTLEGIDRLVLLGDAVELRERRPQAAMQDAEPVMRAVAGVMRGREVIYVPGNHDEPMVSGWIRPRYRGLTVDTLVPRDASARLAEFSRWFSATKFEVRYPGVWLSDGIWATHGHHLNRHLLPTSAVGVPRGWLGRGLRLATPGDYERRRRVVKKERRGWRRRVDPGIVKRLLTPSLSPLIVRMLDAQLGAAGVPSLLRVLEGYPLRPDFVIFGHVHRLGPLPADRRAAWAGEGGYPRVLNTGSWLLEPLLIRHAHPPHPYWPGGAVLIEAGGEPQAIGLLDDLTIEQLRPPPRRSAAAADDR